MPARYLPARATGSYGEIVQDLPQRDIFSNQKIPLRDLPERFLRGIRDTEVAPFPLKDPSSFTGCGGKIERYSREYMRWEISSAGMFGTVLFKHHRTEQVPHSDVGRTRESDVGQISFRNGRKRVSKGIERPRVATALGQTLRLQRNRVCKRP